MTKQEKNNLLSILYQFKAKLYNIFYNPCEQLNIVDRNLTSIEKQIKRL